MEQREEMEKIADFFRKSMISSAVVFLKKIENSSNDHIWIFDDPMT